MLKYLFVLSLCLCFFIFSGTSMAQEVRIGTLLDYTGPLKEFGPNIKNGCELAAKQFKGAGLDVKLFNEDSETSAIPGTNAAKKLWRSIKSWELSDHWPAG